MLDRQLVELSRQRGPIRAVLARIAERLVWSSAWERIGFARLSDYAVECLGLSARTVRSLARVGDRLDRVPALERALASGTLGWTKVRLLAQLPEEEDPELWIEHAQRVTAARLSKQVRAVDRGSVEAGAAGEDARSRRFVVRCTPEVRGQWGAMRGAAGRAAGRMVSVAEAAELVAAEVLSALPIDGHAEPEPCQDDDVSWSQAAQESREEETHAAGCDASLRREGRGDEDAVAPPPWRARSTGPRLVFPRSSQRPAYSPELEALLDGLEGADAFELEDRFRRAHDLERRLDARVASLLVRVWERWAHRALGFLTREAYVRERLGMDPTRARALVRLEHTASLSPAFAAGYRSGALSSVQAAVLEPVVYADPLGRFVARWVRWADRITVRRLRDDVDAALALREADPGAFREHGGLPAEAREDREIGAQSRDTGGEEEDASPKAEREIRAQDRDTEEVPEGAAARRSVESCWVRFIGPAETIQLFRSVVCTVQRRLEQETGQLPTPGEALGAMLDHAFSSWEEHDGRIRANHQVFARDGWRCTAPGCSSMQNLHDHHIRFRSAGGSGEMSNRTTLCVFHHLRGVHAGLLRCVGRAPDGLRWEMGLRPGVTPRLIYRSGDLRVRALDDQPLEGGAAYC